MARKYRLVTLGCKVNQYESQQLRELLESSGLCSAARGERADIAVVNTCAVTAEALRKSRQAIRRVARDTGTPVVVVGCGATADAAKLRTLDGVLAVVGHGADGYAAIRRLFLVRGEREPAFPAQEGDDADGTTPRRRGAEGNEVWMRPSTRHDAVTVLTPRTADSLDVIAPPHVVKVNSPLTGRISSFAGHQRAFLKVQDGCDAACTYCLIPQLRPRLRSKPIEIVVAEAAGLVAAGHREIVLTGVFLGAYGHDTAVRRRWTRTSRSPLAQLVDAVAAVDGLARLRLSSLEPGDVEGALVDVLGRGVACVPHLHLPLQSGSAAILRRMNRQYTPDQFVAMIDRVRAGLDRPAITTDIMVGFPGETEADFDATLAVARHAAFSRIHMFPFSPRSRTPAARWRSDFVPRPVIRERVQCLAELERSLSLDFRRRFLGERERVIVERPHAAHDVPSSWSFVRHGRTDRYFEIHFDDRAARTGDVVSVRIDRVTSKRTWGTRDRPVADALSPPPRVASGPPPDP